MNGFENVKFYLSLLLCGNTSFYLSKVINIFEFNVTRYNYTKESKNIPERRRNKSWIIKQQVKGWQTAELRKKEETFGV